MADVFLSYLSADRERVRPLHAALAHRGFGVFWDQTLPIGMDWDRWIRERLADARAVVVVWSHESVQSKNVRHEAVIAQEQGKLVSVLLDPVPAAQFPIGLYTVEAADLSSWSGEAGSEELEKLLGFLERKLTPLWLQGVLDAKEHLLTDERASRAVVEGHVRTLREQIGRDAAARAQAQDELNRVSTVLGQLRSESETLRKQALEHAAREEAAEAARARLAEVEGRVGELEGSRARAWDSARRWRWAASLLLAALLPGLVLYSSAITARRGLEAQLGEERQRFQSANAELLTARADVQTLTRRVSEAEARPITAATPPPPREPEPTPPPIVCPEVGSRYWPGANTFAASKDFSRECVEVGAWRMSESQSIVGSLFRPPAKPTTPPTATFVAYLLSINGVEVNPSTCPIACLRGGLQETTRPAGGDIVFFIDNTVGIYAKNGQVYELELYADQYYQVVLNSLPPAQRSRFLTVPRRAAPATGSTRKPDR